MDFRKRIKTVPRANLYTEEGYYIWCGTMFRFMDAYYMIYSRWEKEKGFSAWVSDSKVCLARSETAEGRFRHVKTLFDYAGNTPEERRVIHNPAAIVVRGRVYLYFMMNYGCGDFWEHRNRQRIGAAFTDDPEGEWTCLPNPVIDITPGGIDSLMTSNPTVTEMPDGRFLMLYKAVSADGELPRGGSVIIGAATAESPLGPFRKYGKPQFVNPGDPWSVEDPFVWVEDGRFYALVKDYHGYFTGVTTAWSGSTALFVSENGLDWHPDPDHPLAYTNELEFDDGPVSFSSLERPQMYLENGKPRFLLCACRFRKDDDTTYNLKIPLEWQTGHDGPPLHLLDAGQARLPASFRAVSN